MINKNRTWGVQLDYFIHQSWGRIRIKSPTLKNNSFKIDLVKQMLLRQEGVRRISSNAMTGSIVVNYDPYSIWPGKIINLFNSMGLLPKVVGFPGPFHNRQTQAAVKQSQSQSVVASDWLGELSKFVIKAMLDKALSQTSKVLLRKIL